MLKILHVIDALTSAGPTRSLIAAVKYAFQQGILQQHHIITLQSKANPLALILAKQANITVFRKPSQEILTREIEQADIVQIHFWNNPDLYEFIRGRLPQMRLLIWFKIMGRNPPQVITSRLVEYADFVIATSPLTLSLDVFQSLSESEKSRKIGMVYGIADWNRLANLSPRPHCNFNVGYIGTVNFTKMYHRYIPMNIAINVPDIRFIVCGHGIQAILKQQALDLESSEKFDFRGYVENIKPILEIIDIFGYPLCEDTYATSEKSLQEAMFAGIPPVVFPYGGVKDLVENEKTGLVVETEQEYQQAIEYLYYNPDIRLKLGQNAADYARQVFDSKNAVWQLQQIYDRMMQFPKHQRTWRETISGAQNSKSAFQFIQTLGDSAPHFNISITTTNLELLFEAEAKIANSSTLLVEGEGGINNYRNFYPNDSYLRLWSGLVLQNQGKHTMAIAEFNAAINFGINHWRVHWYLAQSALQVEEFESAKLALTQVINAAPSFTKAQELLQTFN